MGRPKSAGSNYVKKSVITPPVTTCQTHCAMLHIVDPAGRSFTQMEPRDWVTDVITPSIVAQSHHCQLYTAFPNSQNYTLGFFARARRLFGRPLQLST